jgi:signal transduction histidine kinase
MKMPSIRGSYARMPIRLKLLVPFGVLMIIWGGFGSFVLVRGQASEARVRASARLADVFNGARAQVTDTERALIETVRLATHTRGVGLAITRRDADTVETLLRPLAVNANARLSVWAAGGSLVQTVTPGGAPATRPAFAAAIRRASEGAADERGDTWASIEGGSLVLAAPARVSGRVVGAVSASESLVGLSGRMARGTPARITLFDGSGERVATSGADPVPYRETGTGVIARVQVGDGTYEVLYGPLVIRGERAGTIAVALPVAVAGTGVGRDIWALVILVAIAVMVAVAIGMLTARAITRPLSMVVDAARSLESGDLSARSGAEGRDEVGMLGHAFDEMAARLQESHADLERKVAERTAELENVNLELARVSSAKSDFLAMMSHELRTPLNSVIGFADMLSDPSFGRPTVAITRELSSNILASGRHLLTLINDVLDLAKVEAGKIEVEPEPVDLQAIVGEIAKIVRPLADAKGHRLVVPTQAVPTALADPARLRQVLLNLVGNAIKFTPDGGTVTLGLRQIDGSVEVSVADDGAGMTAEEAATIFEPFERGNASARTEGAGLGLALARRLVELQGGEIRVESVPELGSTFTFTVPLAPVRAARTRSGSLPRMRSARLKESVRA